ncbi:MAG TPA: ATP-dependent Clp protease ATP-binding subunit, partial [Clostridiales bacterium]|nr:ATP-dependent Clp protease ATP-binding subunit [Clostridiales bacterium]
RRTKNNPVLIGEPGVGKTAVAEGLAQRIASGQVPENLLGKRILMLDLTKMVSGAKFRGDFEERIKGCIEEAAAADNIILFIDELHTLIGAGAAEGSMDAANILKPALSRGEIQVIGATTLTEYRKHIEKDSALERRFQSVLVGEPSPEDTIRILQGLRSRYEEHHKLTITDEALEAAVHLSARYIQDRYLPDKAIDLMDEAASRVRTGNLTVPEEFKVIEGRIAALTAEKEEAVRNQDFERAAMLRDMQRQLQDELSRKQDAWNATRSGSVTAEDVAAVVSSWTGIPVTMLTEDESQRLLRLEQTLHQRVVGQDEAVTAVAKAIRRGRVGLKDPKRPIGVFLFLGPTGVGKTELCKALAAAMFQDENAMIRVDMSEYMERHTVSKLIGSPPGYVGYDEGGQLTEKVRRRPYSVILFDEIEKAHPDVWSALLQIMEDGRLTDAQGRTVDFKNTIIVMTSNIGAKSITGKQKSTLGFSAVDRKEGETRPLSEIKEKVMAEVKNVFSPEFFNRIDDIIVFHQLDSNHIRQIAQNMLNNLAQRVAELGITLEIDDAALQVLVEKGFDPQYGARPLRRVIQTEIEDAAATAYLEGGYREGDTMLVTARNGKIVLEKKTTPKMLAVAQQ